jgi:acetoin utilization deacetylase AcuC-like enzyme
MTPAPVFLEHPSSLHHLTGSHPERPARLVAIEDELAQRGWLGYERVRSPAAARAALAAVHSERHVERIERLAAGGGGQLDPDTVISSGSFEAALHAAGGAVALVDLLVDGDAPTGFSAHRPPGHHAERERAMGFCLFNNVAVGARHALDARGLERVMIVDWDVHHGNGTSDIFYASDRVLLVSIHQSPLYPGTGAASEVGTGAGAGYTVNLPVPPGSGDQLYRSLVDHVVTPLALAFEPQLMLISAGYDAHAEDPLANCAVSEQGFAAITRSIRRVCAELEAPLGAVLEGGYALHALARSVAATLEELGMQPPAPRDSADQVAVAPLARRALGRLAAWWPGLAVPGA